MVKFMIMCAAAEFGPIFVLAGLAVILWPSWFWEARAGKFEDVGLKPIKPASWNKDQVSNGKILIFVGGLLGIIALVLYTSG